MSDPFLALLPQLLQLIEAADEPLTLTELSARSGYSAWHLHRQFRFYCGMPLQSYQRLLKLQRAATALAYRQTPVTELALDAGYQRAESFTRAFGRWLGQAPAQFRQQPDWLYWAEHANQLDQIAVTADQTHSAQALAAVRTEQRSRTCLLQWLHQGHPASIGNSIRRFIEFRRSNKLHPGRFATFNLLYDDPQDTAAAEYRFGLALQLNTAQPEFLQSPELSYVELPAGLYARFDHTGPDAQLESIIRAMYTELLPARGWIPADVPLLLERISFFPDVPAHQAQTRIWLALQTN
ncbi:MAG: helix-turn-helix domain-containing protein [Rheinheimera sp.]|nr:helix-turn-helix domain-containing protein [Rheinheimera sp.]